MNSILRQPVRFTAVLKPKPQLRATLGIGIPIPGPEGPPGPQGDAATITVDGTYTTPPGTSAQVSNLGTPQAAVFAFWIPQGAQGVEGPQGPQGVAGDVGAQGPPGLAATIAVGGTSTVQPGTPASVTNVGTPSAAVLAFQIPQGTPGNAGPTGPPGTPGTSGSITIGGTTTGQPGTLASVINVGTPQNAILEFTIPTGAQGPPGLDAPQQTPWLSNIDANTFSITNLGSINGVPVSSILSSLVPPPGGVTNGYVLSVDSGAATGMSWQPVQGGSGSQTPWTSDIDAAGYGLDNASFFRSTSLWGLSGNVQGPGVGFYYYIPAGEGIIESYNYTTNAYIPLDMEGSPVVVNRDSQANVGIKLASPQYSLDVAGDINCTGEVRINGVPISAGGGSQTPWLSDIDAAGYSLNHLTGITSTSTGSLSIAADWALYLSAYYGGSRILIAQGGSEAMPALTVRGGGGQAGGNFYVTDWSWSSYAIWADVGPPVRVGIGTSSPACLLDVSGAAVTVSPYPAQPAIARITADNYLCFLDVVSQGYGYSGVQFITDGRVIGRIEGNYGSRIDIYVQTSLYTSFSMTVASTSRVGIGITNPQYTLDVAGDCNLSAGSVYRINGVPISTGGGGGSQTPWTSNIEGAGYALNNASAVRLRSGSQNPGLNIQGSAVFSFTTTGAGVLTMGRAASSATYGTVWMQADDGYAGSPLSLNPIGGNVGIGTLNPQAALDVAAGGIACESLLVRGGRVLLYNPDQYYTQIQMNSDTLNWIFSLAGSGTGLPGSLILYRNTEVTVTFSPSGNVGIGTQNPAYPLEVVGTIAAQGILLTRAGYYDFSYASTANTYLGCGYGWGVYIGSPIVIMIDSGKGRVGINTLSPAYTLDVVGDCNLSAGSVYRINGVPISAGGGGSPAGSNGQIQFNRNAAFAADQNFWWDGDFLNIEDLTSARNTLFFGTWASRAHIAAWSISPNVPIDMWVEASNIRFATNSPAAPVERMRLDSQGRLGIGTVSPQYALDVVGDINLTGGVYRVNGTPISTGGGSSQWTDVAGGGIYYGGGSVGIGTTAPGALLSLGQTTVPIKIAVYDGGAINSYGIGVMPGRLTFGSSIDPASGTPQMVLDTAGNLGLGTQTPIARVHSGGNGWIPSSAGLAGIALLADGQFGGGIGIRDGGDTIALYSLAGHLNFGTGTSSSGIAQGMVLTKQGYLGIGVPYNATVDPLTIQGVGGGGQIRMIHGPYGVFFRNDGATLYLMVTNANDQYGAWKSVFPMTVDLATCCVGIRQGPNLGYGLTVDSMIVSNTATILNSATIQGRTNVGNSNEAFALSMKFNDGVPVCFIGCDWQGNCQISNDGGSWLCIVYRDGSGINVNGNCNVSGGYYVNGSLFNPGSVTNFASGNRALGTTYQNNTGKPLFVVISIYFNNPAFVTAYCDGGNPPGTVVATTGPAGNAWSDRRSMSFIVLPGWFYRTDTPTVTLESWSEWW